MTAALTASAKNHMATQHHDLKVRQMDFDLKDIPEFWYDNDPFKTLLLSALSGGFPAGEHFLFTQFVIFKTKLKPPSYAKRYALLLAKKHITPKNTKY